MTLEIKQLFREGRLQTERNDRAASACKGYQPVGSLRRAR